MQDWKIARQDKTAEQRFFDRSARIKTSKAELGKEWVYYTLLFSKAFRGIPNEALQGMALDFGCGCGGSSLYLSKRGMEVVGVDISLESVKLAHRRSKDLSAPVSFVICDIENLPFSPSAFDLVFCVAVMHHFPYLLSVARQVSSVTKDSGLLVAFELNGLNPFALMRNNRLSPLKSKQVTPNESTLTPDDLQGVLDQVGFDQFEFDSVNPPFAIVCGGIVNRFLSELRRVIVPSVCERLPGLRKGFLLIVRCVKRPDRKASRIERIESRSPRSRFE